MCCTLDGYILGIECNNDNRMCERPSLCAPQKKLISSTVREQR